MFCLDIYIMDAFYLRVNDMFAHPFSFPWFVARRCGWLVELLEVDIFFPPELDFQFFPAVPYI